MVYVLGMAHPPPRGTAGKRLGPYEIVEWLATGGMAEVYVARRTGAYGFTKSVALKRILPQFSRDAEFVAMFIDEARVCARLSHPNIVEVFDFGEDQGELYMAMELVEGTTGAKLVRAAAARGETVPVEDALFIAASVLRGLELAHGMTDDEGRPANLVHRDVSPGNVLLSRTGAVKLGDFGIVRAAHVDRRTEQGQMKGKLGYMSPEQVLGREVDARSDLFTVGILMAELLTGRPLFSHGQELDILFRIRDADTSAFTRNAGHLPEEIRSLVYRALAKDPDERYPSAAAFADAIEDLVRRRRLALGPNRLSALLEYLGLVKTSRSGEFRLGMLSVGTPKAPKVTAPEEVTAESARPTAYRVRRSDGTDLGPLPLPRVLELVVSGGATADSLVSRDDGPFVPAREHAELRRVTSSSAHRWELDVRTAGTRQPIELASLPYHLFGVALRRETGVLLAERGAARKKIYLVDGKIEFASSTEPSELIGSRFVHENLILPVELDMALAVAPRFGGRVGDALVGLGILRPVDVFRGVVEQMRARVIDVLKWREGMVTFVRGVRSHEEAPPVPLSPFEILARGIREAYDDDEISAVLAPLLGAAPQPGERGALPPIALGLPDVEGEVLLAVDGTLTVSDLLRDQTTRLGLSRRDVSRALFIGLSARTISLPGWPPDVSTAKTQPGKKA